MSIHYKNTETSIKSYIWESSISRSPISFKPRASSNRRSSSLRKTPNPRNPESLYENQPQRNFFTSHSSRLMHRPATQQESPIEIRQKEEIRLLDKSANAFFRQGPEKCIEEDKIRFIVHHYARPRRLIAIREKSFRRLDEKKRVVCTPAVKLGIGGWKLSQPRSASPDCGIKRDFNKINPHLQIISKRIK